MNPFFFFSGAPLPASPFPQKQINMFGGNFIELNSQFSFLAISFSIPPLSFQFYPVYCFLINSLLNS